LGSDSVANDEFGYSVAISGTTAVVGAWFHAGYTGRAYVFENTGGAWRQVAPLLGSDTVAGDWFGSSVAVSGTTIVVGAWLADNEAGRAYVFTQTGGAWRQTAELKGSDTVANDGFGDSVAISGRTIVVGSSGHANFAGRAYVFENSGGAWRQTAELTGSYTAGLGMFGDSVAISGITVIVGSCVAMPGGAAYVFTQTGGVWRQVAELENSDMVVADLFGDSVAISGRTAIVGAPGQAKQRIYPGRAYVFAS
jgi:hypothetical protein